MNKADGYVKLDRALLNEEWFKNPKAVQLYIFILLAANHKDGNFNGLEVKRGQLITSLDHMAEATGQTKDSIRHNLKVLTDYTTVYTTAMKRRFTSILLRNYGGKLHQNPTVRATVNTTNIRNNIKESSQGESKDSPEKKKRVRPDF